MMKKFSETLSESQKVYIMLVLILVQTVCKGYQQMTKVASSKERVKCVFLIHLIQEWKNGIFLSNFCRYPLAPIQKLNRELLQCQNRLMNLGMWWTHLLMVG